MTTKDLITKNEILAEASSWDYTEQKIKEEVEATKGLTIDGHVGGPKAGFLVVSDMRKKLKNMRCAIAAKHKELKADVLREGRKYDAVKNYLIAMIEPREKELEADEERYKEQVEREKAEAEAKRQKALNERLQKMQNAGMPANVKWAQDATQDEFDRAVAEAAEKLAIEKKRQEEQKKAAEAKAAEDKRRARLLMDIGADFDFIDRCQKLTLDKFETIYGAEKEAYKAKKAYEEQKERERQEELDKARYAREKLEQKARRLEKETRDFEARVKAEKEAKEKEERDKLASERSKELESGGLYPYVSFERDLWDITSQDWDDIVAGAKKDKADAKALERQKLEQDKKRKIEIKPDLEKIEAYAEDLYNLIKKSPSITDAIVRSNFDAIMMDAINVHDKLVTLIGGNRDSM